MKLLPYIFGSRGLAGKIVIKLMINTITQARDKTTNALNVQGEFEG